MMCCRVARESSRFELTVRGCNPAHWEPVTGTDLLREIAVRVQSTEA